MFLNLKSSCIKKTKKEKRKMMKPIITLQKRKKAKIGQKLLEASRNSQNQVVSLPKKRETVRMIKVEYNLPTRQNITKPEKKS